MKKKRNKDNDIVISFLGGSRDNVTGSAVLISYPTKEDRKCILLECGMIQQESRAEFIYSANKKLIENIPIADISGVFLMHEHIDHSGNMAIFGKEAFNGKIIMSKKCQLITQDLLKDSVFLHSKLIEELHSKGKRSKPLYNEIDMYQMFDKIETKDLHVQYKFDDNLSYEFFNSGHVVGGTQLKLTFRLPNSSIKTLLYTSDLGSAYNLKYKPYIEPMEVVEKATMCIFEGTYGIANKCFNKNLVEQERKELKALIEKYIKNNKRVFIPSFSFGRTQELMVLLYNYFKDEEWFNDIPIIIDGKLTNTICSSYSKILEDEDLEHWEQVRDWKNFRYNKEYKGTLSYLAKRESGIYISSSGFIQSKTRSCEYAKNFMGREGDLICFVGYYGKEGSTSYELVNRPIGSAISIDGTTLIKHCDVVSFKTFSSHIQQEEIFKYWSQINTTKILIHHADEEGKAEMKVKGEEYLRERNKTTKIIPVGVHASQFIL